MPGRGKKGKVTNPGGLQGSETLKLPHFLDIRLTDGGKVVSLIRRPPFTPRMILGTHFCKGCVDPRAIMRLEGLGQLKNPMTSS
jgi:hypothetical protein